MAHKMVQNNVLSRLPSATPVVTLTRSVHRISGSQILGRVFLEQVDWFGTLFHLGPLVRACSVPSHYSPLSSSLRNEAEMEFCVRLQQTHTKYLAPLSQTGL